MIKNSKFTDSASKQIGDDVVQTKPGLANVGPKSLHFTNSKEVTHSNKKEDVAKE